MTRPEVAALRSQRVAQLIELGRDREAAELAQASDAWLGDDRVPTRGGTMDVFSQLDELGPLLGGVVGGITADQLGDATPCTDFTVQGVLEHMIGGATMFTAAFTGTEPADPELGDVLGGFGPTLAALAGSIHSAGALDRTIQAPFGEVDGTTFARFVVLDGLVHGWDLARATGQAYEPSDALVAEVQGFAAVALPPLQGSGAFGPAVDPPAGAAPMDRLAAFAGRPV